MTYWTWNRGKKSRADALRAITRILTEDQRVAYEKMLGEPYDEAAFVCGESGTAK